MDVARRILDGALDLAVVPGYTSLGYRARGLGWAEAFAGGFARGRTAVVTGASSGIGELVCEGLAAGGAEVVMVARDEERAEAARARILDRLGGGAGPGALEIELCDLSERDQVRDLAARLEARPGDLAVLVNNAGALPSERRRTSEGFELTFATNVLGPFMLTNLLLAAMRRSAPARVINVTSGGMYTARLDVDDLQLERRSFDGARFYAHTKRIEVILTRIWAEREPRGQVAFHAVHPGWVDTPGLAASLPGFHRALSPLLRDARQGADSIVWLASERDLPGASGELWHDRETRPRNRLPRTAETAAERLRLWDRLTELAGGAAPGAEAAR